MESTQATYDYASLLAAGVVFFTMTAAFLMPLVYQSGKGISLFSAFFWENSEPEVGVVILFASYTLVFSAVIAAVMGVSRTVARIGGLGLFFASLPAVALLVFCIMMVGNSSLWGKGATYAHTPIAVVLPIAALLGGIQGLGLAFFGRSPSGGVWLVEAFVVLVAVVVAGLLDLLGVRLD